MTEPENFCRKIYLGVKNVAFGGCITLFSNGRKITQYITTSSAFKIMPGQFGFSFCYRISKFSTTAAIFVVKKCSSAVITNMA